jgi:hypothetical protein
LEVAKYGEARISKSWRLHDPAWQTGKADLLAVVPVLLLERYQSTYKYKDTTP